MRCSTKVRLSVCELVNSEVTELNSGKLDKIL